MRWTYVKVFEDEERIRYAYAREDKLVSGFVDYMKKTEQAQMVIPAEMDTDSEFRQGKALEHLYSVKSRGFPEKAQIDCG